MKSFRLFSLVFCLMFLAILFSSSTSTQADRGDETEVRFRWAFGALVGGPDDRSMVSITHDRALKTGDRLKMLVELEKRCFVYLIYQSGLNELHMLFPYNLNQYEADYRINKKYYIPNNEQWFELDENTGRESFHLIASNRRLFELERLLSEYQGSQSPKKDELLKEVLAEIRKRKKLNRKLTMTAERPILIGGNMRSGKKMKSPDISIIASPVSASKFYSRTFTIDHQ